MARYELALKHGTAISLRIIFKAVLTPKRRLKIKEVSEKNKKNKFYLARSLVVCTVTMPLVLRPQPAVTGSHF